MYKKIRKIVILISTLVLIISAVYITINYNNHLLVEKKLNNNSIYSTIVKIDEKLQLLYNKSLNLANITAIINNKNSYIYEDLNIDYFIITDKNNKVIYSEIKDIKNENVKNDIEIKIINSYENQKESKSIIKINKQSYLSSKVNIHKNNEALSNHVYIGIKITNNMLKNTKPRESLISITPAKFSNYYVENTSIKNFSNIRIETKKEKNYFSNNIYFFNQNEKEILILNLKNKLQLKTNNIILLVFFPLIIIFITISIFYLYNQMKKELNEKNEIVKNEISKKTEQTKIALLELEKVNTKLYELAHTDFLTKTMNRRSFFKNAQDVFVFSKKNNQELSAIMIDLDNFKTINDRYGHHIGDKVLVEFAKTIKNNINKNDIFGRLGGEEFALILPNTDITTAIKKAIELKEKVQNIELHINNSLLKFTASFGVSNIEDCTSLDEVLKKTDKLLYDAKKSGRNIVRNS